MIFYRPDQTECHPVTHKIKEMTIRQKKKKGLSHEPARISMWRRFSALVYAATVFLKVFFFFTLSIPGNFGQCGVVYTMKQAIQRERHSSCYN